MSQRYTLQALRELARREPLDRDFAAEPGFLRAVRDLYFDVSAGLLPDSARDLLSRLTLIAQPPRIEVGTQKVCCCPDRRFMLLRYVSRRALPRAVRDAFACPVPGMPELAAVFVDPAALDYQSFENILPLDVCFEGVPTTLRLVERQRIGRLRDAWTFRIEAPPALRHALTVLGTQGPHAAPLDREGRGGQRLIFHAAALSEAIGAAAQAALPAAALEGFSHANGVLRCSRFEAGEAVGFAPHFDTPYSDTALKQISKYTVLLYITGGRGAPALSLNQTALEEIAPMTAVIFHHRYRHRAAPYQDGVKLFYRTELVYEVDALGFDEEVARRFGQACYLVGYSRDNAAVAARMRVMFDAVAAARWGLPGDGEPPQPVWFLKSHVLTDAVYLCNGHDYWFHGGHGLKASAVTALLDYFNAQVPRGVSFRWMCTEEVVAPDGEGTETAWIAARLGAGDPLATPLSLERLLEPAEEPDPDGDCCPSHHPSTFQPRRSEAVIAAYRRRQEQVREGLAGAPVVMLGCAVFFLPERIIVGERHLYVVAEEGLGPINFAGGWSPPCWDVHDHSDFIEAEVELEGLVLVVPPIAYERVDGCIHLMLDYFRSGWLSSWGNTGELEVPAIQR